MLLACRGLNSKSYTPHQVTIVISTNAGVALPLEGVRQNQASLITQNPKPSITLNPTPYTLHPCQP